jgi:hypothetical protein
VEAGTETAEINELDFRRPPLSVMLDGGFFDARYTYVGNIVVHNQRLSFAVFKMYLSVDFLFRKVTIDYFLSGLQKPYSLYFDLRIGGLSTLVGR